MSKNTSKSNQNSEKMSNARISKKSYLLGLVVMFMMSSCSVTLPRFSKTTTGVTITNENAQLESLTREEYTVLRKTTGKASTTRCYILFIPIGKHKTNSELFDNAYYEAVENLPNADALIFPRQKTKKLTIPLLLFNYNKRTTTVTGVGISVKDKILENTELDVPYTVLEEYQLRSTVDSKQISNYKIRTEKEFDKYFQRSSGPRSTGESPIDFSTQYAIVLIGNSTNTSSNYSVNHLRLKGSKLELSYNIEEGEQQAEPQQPFLILVIDKEYEGEIIAN